MLGQSTRKQSVDGSTLFNADLADVFEDMFDGVSGGVKEHYLKIPPQKLQQLRISSITY